MAYAPGIQDFVRVQGSDQYGIPTQQVYATGTGGKPIGSEQELSKLSGGALTSGSQARTISPQEAVSLGIVDFAKAPTNPVSNSSTITQNTAQQQIDTLNKQIAEYTAQQKTQAQQASQASNSLLGKIGEVISQKQALPQFDAQASYTNALSQYGFTPEMFTKMNQSVTTLDTLNKQIAALETEEQTRLMNNDQRQAPMDFIEGEGAKISRAYAIKKSGVSAQASAVAATLEALRGNLSQANALASETVKNLAYNYQQKVDDLQWSFDAYSTLYNSMSQKEQSAWKNVYDSAVNELNSKKTDYTNLMNLMIQYPDASWPTDISTLSLADATQIAMQSAAKAQALATQKSQLEIQQAQADLAKTKAETANIGSGNTTDKEDLIETIQNIVTNNLIGTYGEAGTASGAFQTREQMIDQLAILYPKIPRPEIANTVYTMIKDKGQLANTQKAPETIAPKPTQAVITKTGVGSGANINLSSGEYVTSTGSRGNLFEDINGLNKNFGLITAR